VWAVLGATPNLILSASAVGVLALVLGGVVNRAWGLVVATLLAVMGLLIAWVTRGSERPADTLARWVPTVVAVLADGVAVAALLLTR
jgi:hypothetical protein